MLQEELKVNNLINKYRVLNDNLSAKGVRIPTVVALVLLIIILSFTAKNFATINNFMVVLRQISVNAILGYGMTFVILTAGIDLSVGPIIALTGVLSAMMINAGINPFIVILSIPIMGGICGAFNGLLIARGRMFPFVVTMATQVVFKGITYLICGGRPIMMDSKNPFIQVGTGFFLGIPIPIYIFIIVLILAYFLLMHTQFGKRVYIVGGNRETARLSGINVPNVITWIYIISGICASIAGMILTTRLYSGQPQTGTGYELDAVAATVLGGASLSGGKGTVLGTMIGAIIIGILNNGMTLLGISAYWQYVVKGAVIILAVLMDKDRIY